MLFVIIVCSILLVLFIIVTLSKADFSDFTIESGKKRAGRRGEDIAFNYISEVLTPEDTILRNVELEFDGKECECDNIIVNRYGVFIIEIKNWNGKLSGSLDDYDWTKTKVTDAGSVFVSTVTNPIKQVNRQVYILSNYLKDNGIFYWIKGYSIILDDKSVISDQVLHTVEDINKVIHTKAQENTRYLSKTKQEEIINLLR